MTVQINVAEEFSPMPIGRHEKYGEYSGEGFRKKLLTPHFTEAIAKKWHLLINLNNVAGLNSSFLEEAF